MSIKTFCAVVNLKDAKFGMQRKTFPATVMASIAANRSWFRSGPEEQGFPSIPFGIKWRVRTRIFATTIKPLSHEAICCDEKEENCSYYDFKI